MCVRYIEKKDIYKKKISIAFQRGGNVAKNGLVCLKKTILKIILNKFMLKK